MDQHFVCGLRATSVGPHVTLGSWGKRMASALLQRVLALQIARGAEITQSSPRAGRSRYPPQHGSFIPPAGCLRWHLISETRRLCEWAFSTER